MAVGKIASTEASFISTTNTSAPRPAYLRTRRKQKTYMYVKTEKMSGEALV